MNLHTASETISYIREFEEKQAKFYEELAKMDAGNEELLLSYAKENRKFYSQIQRTYQSVITDAIEGCYAFDLETDDYDFNTELPEKASYSDALARAITIEENILKFYDIATEQSMSLMADVPRNFKIVVKKRKNRIPTLKSLG